MEKRFFFFVFVLYSFAIFSQKPFISFDEIEEGMVGKGYTVLKNEEVEEFDIEIIGKQSMFLENLKRVFLLIKDERFQKTGILAAMSGSPVFVNGKFAGAISATYIFSKEPIGIMTPADDILNLLKGNASSKETNKYVYLKLKEPFYDGNKVNLDELLKPLNTSGFDFLAVSNKNSEKDELKEGGMICVKLISGDLSFGAYGTVTLIDKEQFVAFGHPLLNLGIVDFPVFKAKVTTAIPTYTLSFKVSESLEEIGRVVMDSESGILCEKERRADTLKVKFFFKDGDRVEEKNVNLVRNDLLIKRLLAISILTLYEQNVSKKIDSSIFLNLSLTFENGKKFGIRKQHFGGDEPIERATYFILDVFSLLTDNPFQKMKIKEMEISFDIKKGKSIGRILEVRTNKNKYNKGEDIEIFGRVMDFGGKIREFKRKVSTNDFSYGKLKLFFSDSLTLFEKVKKSSFFIPNDFETILKLLEELKEGGYLYLTVFEDSDVFITRERRVFSLPLTLKEMLSNQESKKLKGERIVLKPLSLIDMDYFSYDGEIEVEILKRSE